MKGNSMMRVNSYFFYNLSHSNFDHFFYFYSLSLVINNFVKKSLSRFFPNLRRKLLCRYFPPKASFFFIFFNVKIDLKELDLTLGIRILLPPLRSLGFKLKLKEVTGDGGALDWALELESGSPVSIFGRGKVFIPVKKFFPLLLPRNLRGKKGCLRPPRILPLV